MRKLITAIVMVFLFVQLSYATTTALAPTTTYDVGNNGQIEKYVYESATSVTNGADQIFKITTPGIYGNITGIKFNAGDSTNCDAWVSESDNQTATSVQTKIYFTDVNVGYGPELSAPVYYRNRDATPAAFLYFQISNQDAGNPTAAWKLDIIYGK